MPFQSRAKGDSSILRHFGTKKMHKLSKEHKSQPNFP